VEGSTALSETRCCGGGSQLFGKVGGLELWTKLHSEMVIKLPSSDFLRKVL